MITSANMDGNSQIKSTIYTAQQLKLSPSPHIFKKIFHSVFFRFCPMKGRVCVMGIFRGKALLKKGEKTGKLSSPVVVEK